MQFSLTKPVFRHALNAQKCTRRAHSTSLSRLPHSMPTNGHGCTSGARTFPVFWETVESNFSHACRSDFTKVVREFIDLRATRQGYRWLECEPSFRAMPWPLQSPMQADTRAKGH